MIRNIEAHNGYTIQKITSPKGAVTCYQTFPSDKIGDSFWRREFRTLTEARNSVGADTKPKRKHYVPK